MHCKILFLALFSISFSCSVFAQEETITLTNNEYKHECFYCEKYNTSKETTSQCSYKPANKTYVCAGETFNPIQDVIKGNDFVNTSSFSSKLLRILWEDTDECTHRDNESDKHDIRIKLINSESRAFPFSRKEMDEKIYSFVNSTTCLEYKRKITEENQKEIEELEKRRSTQYLNKDYMDSVYWTCAEAYLGAKVDFITEDYLSAIKSNKLILNLMVNLKNRDGKSTFILKDFNKFYSFNSMKYPYYDLERICIPNTDFMSRIWRSHYKLGQYDKLSTYSLYSENAIIELRKASNHVASTYKKRDLQIYKDIKNARSKKYSYSEVVNGRKQQIVDSLYLIRSHFGNDSIRNFLGIINPIIDVLDENILSINLFNSIITCNKDLVREWTSKWDKNQQYDVRKNVKTNVKNMIDAYLKVENLESKKSKCIQKNAKFLY